MSAAATANAAKPADAPAKPKRRKLIFIGVGVLVVALIAAGGALFLLKKNAADEYADEETEAAATEPERPTTPPAFLALDNMVVNLADAGGNRFAQVGISLQIENEKTGEEMKKYMPSIRSSVLLLISQRSSDELLQLAGKEKLAKDIVAEISRIMGYRMPEKAGGGATGTDKIKRDSKLPPNPVQAVLFSSFIVQ